MQKNRILRRSREAIYGNILLADPVARSYFWLRGSGRIKPEGRYGPAKGILALTSVHDGENGGLPERSFFDDGGFHPSYPGIRANLGLKQAPIPLIQPFPVGLFQLFLTGDFRESISLTRIGWLRALP